MAQNWYHGKDASIVAGSANFGGLIATGFASYGLTTGQQAAFNALNTILQAKYSAAITPDTRTPVAIEGKNLAIVNVRRSAVALSKIIYATLTVTDEQLVALGLLPRTVPTPIPATMTPPVVTIKSVVGRLVEITIKQAGTESRARPLGSAGAQVYSFVGDEPAADPGAYKFEGLATRGVAAVLFSNEVASGATAWISCAWVSRRGQRGFGSDPIRVTIQGGPVVATA